MIWEIVIICVTVAFVAWTRSRLSEDVDTVEDGLDLEAAMRQTTDDTLRADLVKLREEFESVGRVVAKHEGEMGKVRKAMENGTLTAAFGGKRS